MISFVRLLRGAVSLAPVLAFAACFGAPAADPLPVPPAAADQILNHLNGVLRWYRQSQTGSQWIIQPSDVYYWSTQRDLAVKVAQLAFQSAEAESLLVPEQPAAGASAKTDTQRIESQIAAITDRLDEAAGALAVLQRQIQSAPNGGPDTALRAQESALQGAVHLYTAMLDALRKAASIAGGGDEAAGAGLADQIQALKRLEPSVFAQQPASPAAPGLQAPTAAGSNGGLFGRAEELFTLVRSRFALDGLISETGGLQSTVLQLLSPLRQNIRGTVVLGQNEAEKIGGNDPKEWAAAGATLDRTAAQFSRLAAAIQPLRQEEARLDEYATNLRQWRDSFDQQYGAIIRDLLGRLLAVLAAIALLVGISEIWRRATFRYVHDARRRRQFLLVRRIVTGAVMAIVVALGFVSDFGSLATFAGFITAGIAVALQAIILSVAAYFFLIGRYGVRVGDRVTVSGVTGEVIDIGLVRVYLMELVGSGADWHSTGRMVVFANSALFQAAPLYKQIPGTDYTWHEIAIPLVPDGEHSLAQKELVAAVQSVYGGYKERLERQHQITERLIDLRLDLPEPSGRLRFTDAGVELAIRFPVETRHAEEADDAVAARVLEVIRKNEKLRAAVAGTPRIRSMVKI